MSEDGETPKFDMADVKHPRVEKYKPEFVGVGGQYVVYSLPDYPNHVVKVEADMLLRTTEGRLKTGKAPNLEVVQQRLNEQNRRIGALREHFGPEHALEQSSHYLKVPVNKRLISEVYARHRKGTTPPSEMLNFEGNESWSIVSVQEKCPELSDPNRMSVTSGYAETREEANKPDFQDTYRQVTQETIFDTKSKGTVIPEDLARLHPRLEKPLFAAKDDPEFRDCLKDFAKKSIQYTLDTGEALDLAGQDNVIFFKNSEGKWSYKLPDALYPSPPLNSEGKVKEVQDIIAHASTDGVNALNNGERNVLMNTVNYVRVVNGLANWLGVEERINLVPKEVTNIEPQSIMDAISQPKATKKDE